MSHSLPSSAFLDRHAPARRSWRWALGLLAALVSGLVLVAFGTAGAASAAGAPVGLGTASAYSVLAGQTVTNTGPSRLAGSLGLSPGSAITGFPPGKTSGATHAGDAVALKAQSDLTIGYNDAAGRAPSASVAGDLVGRTLSAGVYNSSGPLALSGTLTLDAQGDPNAVFVFQAASTLITASASYVNMINGAQACNVFWQVGSSATLGTASVFRGTILALTSVSVTTGVVVQGRALARNGAVTLDNDVFTSPACGTTTPAKPSTTTVSVAPTTTTTGSTVTSTATVTGGSSTPTGGVVFSSGGTTVGTAPVDSTGRAVVTLPAGNHAGTRTITATYGGSPTLLPSTSSPRTITVRPAARPGSSPPSSAPSSTGATAVPTAPSTTVAPLAATGTAHLDTLIPAALVLLGLGAVLSVTGRRRRPGAHR